MDIITNGIAINLCEKLGSPRRCGGQGDLLSGMLATLIGWKMDDKDCEQSVCALSAAAAAAHLGRSINWKVIENLPFFTA